MVEKQIAERGVEHQAVLDAMRAVPREMFVPEAAVDFATRTGPSVSSGANDFPALRVALMAAALELSPRDRVLEIGAGSGYARPFSPAWRRKVYAIERHAVLVELARRRMKGSWIRQRSHLPRRWNVLTGPRHTEQLLLRGVVPTGSPAARR